MGAVVSKNSDKHLNCPTLWHILNYLLIVCLLLINAKYWSSSKALLPVYMNFNEVQV